MTDFTIGTNSLAVYEVMKVPTSYYIGLLLIFIYIIGSDVCKYIPSPVILDLSNNMCIHTRISTQDGFLQQLITS